MASSLSRHERGTNYLFVWSQVQGEIAVAVLPVRFCAFFQQGNGSITL